MKYILILIFFATIYYCRQKNSSVKTVTLTITHECTGCLDAVVLDHNYKLPDTIARDVYNANSKDLLLAGNNPYKGKTIPDDIFEYKLQITGYFSGIDSLNNSVGKVPVFYVTEWKKIGEK